MNLIRNWAMLLLVAVPLCDLSQPVSHAAPTTIEVHAKRFAFSPSEITIPKGETVTITLTSDDAPHSLVIEGLGVNAPITKGKATVITVTPQKTGDFNGRCGHFCGSGHGQMTFTVHVADK